MNADYKPSEIMGWGIAGTSEHPAVVDGGSMPEHTHTHTLELPNGPFSRGRLGSLKSFRGVQG